MSKLSITAIKQDDTYLNMGYCPYMEINSAASGGSYKTLTEGLIVPEKRDFDANSAIPASLPNGGLYSGPQSTEPWANIPIIPSGTNLIHYNLRSANPPPGATEQYVGTDRLGNNYVPMIGVNWYNPENLKGLYRMNVTNKADMKQY